MFWILKGPKMAANFINNVLNNNNIFKGDNFPGCGQHKSGYNRLNLVDDDPNGNVISSSIGSLNIENKAPIGRSYLFQQNPSNDFNSLDKSSTHSLTSLRLKGNYENEKVSKPNQWPNQSVMPSKPTSPSSYSSFQSDYTAATTPTSSLWSSNDVEMTSFITSDYNCDFGSTSSHVSEEDLGDSEEDDEDLTCNVCDRSYPTIQHLISHQMKRRHYGCSVCEDIFPTFMALESHKELTGHTSEDDEIYYEEDDDDDDDDDDEEDDDEDEDDEDEDNRANGEDGEEGERERLL